MRPIICCVGTFMNNLSCWLDHWLQKLKPFTPSYLKDSNKLLLILKLLERLPEGAQLFAANANYMYTKYSHRQYYYCHYSLARQS